MKRTNFRLLPCVALLGAASQGGCLTREVPEDIYIDDVSYAVNSSDSASEEGGGGGGVPLSNTGQAPRASVGDSGIPPEAQEADDGGTMEPNSPEEPPSSECDLSGRWLVTERRVAVGLGVQQAGLYWLYIDFAQSGDQLTVTKGLICGSTVQPIGALSASVEMEGCWQSLMSDNPMDGLKGRVSANANGCELHLDRFYSVFGATADHYRDPNVAMPALEEEASGTTPGWEDCDQDGRPGATLNVSGIVSGWRAEAIRSWSEYDGTIPKGASKFQVPIDWNQTEAVYAVSGEALKATGGKDGNNSLHFAQFARLSDDQAAGATDDVICQEIRALGPQLTPEANE